MNAEQGKKVVAAVEGGGVILVGNWTGSKTETVKYISKDTGKQESFDRTIGAVLIGPIPIIVEAPKGTDPVKMQLAASTFCLVRAVKMDTRGGVVTVSGIPEAL